MRINCLTQGATDFLGKPVNAGELIARVRNTILAKAHLDRLADYSGQLEREVRLRTADLDVAWREAIQCLARAGELRDDQTGQHVFRVGRYAAIIARELGFSDERVQWLEYAAQLHYLGKIGIPDSILNKPGRLTDDEIHVMRDHCEFGRRVIKNETKITANRTDNVEKTISRSTIECHSPIMQLAAVVAESHHEKWDGTGYPHKLKEEAIPLEGRITAVADVFDAISSKRVYKDALPIDECFDCIREGSGSHFDPSVVQAFLNRRSEIMAVYLLHNDINATT
jgi:putative two-component system response regulator